MYTPINTKEDIKKYLSKRLRLNDAILEKMAEKVMYEYPIGILYNKKYDRLYFYLDHKRNCGWFNVRYWLSQHAKQCACCGEWYFQNENSDIMEYEVRNMFGQNVTAQRYICESCADRYTYTTEIIALTEYAIKTGWLTYDKAWLPTTHIAGRYIHHEYGSPSIY